MGKKTSVYLHDQLAAEVEASGLPLAKLIQRGVAVAPLLTEENERAGFITRWYCEVPAEGTRFQVLEDQWLDQEPGKLPIREVYKINVTSQQEPA